MFEDGILTDATGQAVDCKHAIFIMTSNIGARVIQKRSSVGFQANADSSRERMEDEVMQKVKQTFQPEFINRLDEIIIFDELTDDDLLRIVDLQVAKLNKIVEGRDLRVVLTEQARKWLIDKTCTDRKYGARPLKACFAKIRRRRAERSPHPGRRRRRQHHRGLPRRRQTRLPRGPRKESGKGNSPQSLRIERGQNG